MDTERARISLRIYAFRAWSWLRLGVAVAGFAAIAYALYGIWQAYETVRVARVAMNGQAFESVLLGAVEMQIVLLLVGVVTVFIATR